MAVWYAGIGRTTYYRWIHRGQEASDGIYREFYEAVRRAMARAEVRAVMILRQAMAKDWRAAMCWLERRYPNRWGLPHRRGPFFDPRKVLCKLLGLSERELLEIDLGVP